MSTTPPAIQYSGPPISANVPWDVRVHLQQIYQKLGNHTQAFSLIQQSIGNSSVAKSTTTNTVNGGSGASAGGTAIPNSQGSPTGVIPGEGVGTKVNNQSGVTAYTNVPGDDGAMIVLSDASAIAFTLAGQTPPYSFFVTNQGAGAATFTPPTGSTISYAGNAGAASLPLPGGYSALLAFDGTNWWAWTDPVAAAAGVTQIIAGTNVTISPAGGTGAVTINATGGGGGSYSLGGSISSSNVNLLSGGAGSGASLITAAGLDGNHTIQFTAGTGSVALAPLLIFTFTNPRGNTTYPILSYGLQQYSSLGQVPQVIQPSATNSQYTMYCGSVALTSGVSYVFNVSCP